MTTPTPPPEPTAVRRGPPPGRRGRPARPAQPPSLRRELLAIAVLYGILSILPLCIGLAFAP